MKRKLLILVFIFIIISGVKYVHASTEDVVLNVNSTKVKPGEIFTVTMSATCSNGINGIFGKEEYDGIGFSYDTSKFELISREASILTDANSGNRTIALIYIGSETITSGNVYTWTFKVKDNAEVGKTEFSTTEIILADFSGSTIEIGTKTAKIEIITESNTNTNTNANTSKDNKTTQTNIATDTIGKKPDVSTVKTLLPKTGFVYITGIAIIILCIISIVFYKKLKKYDDIK